MPQPPSPRAKHAAYVRLLAECRRLNFPTDPGNPSTQPLPPVACASVPNPHRSPTHSARRRFRWVLGAGGRNDPRCRGLPGRLLPRVPGARSRSLCKVESFVHLFRPFTHELVAHVPESTPLRSLFRRMTLYSKRRAVPVRVFARDCANKNEACRLLDDGLWKRHSASPGGASAGFRLSQPIPIRFILLHRQRQASTLSLETNRSDLLRPDFVLEIPVQLAWRLPTGEIPGMRPVFVQILHRPAPLLLSGPTPVLLSGFERDIQAMPRRGETVLHQPLLAPGSGGRVLGPRETPDRALPLCNPLPCLRTRLICATRLQNLPCPTCPVKYSHGVWHSCCDMLVSDATRLTVGSKYEDGLLDPTAPDVNRPKATVGSKYRRLFFPGLPR